MSDVKVYLEENTHNKKGDGYKVVIRIKGKSFRSPWISNSSDGQAMAHQTSQILGLPEYYMGAIRCPV